MKQEQLFSTQPSLISQAYPASFSTTPGKTGLPGDTQTCLARRPGHGGGNRCSRGDGLSTRSTRVYHSPRCSGGPGRLSQVGGLGGRVLNHLAAGQVPGSPSRGVCCSAGAALGAHRPGLVWARWRLEEWRDSEGAVLRRGALPEVITAWITKDLRTRAGRQRSPAC